jgi:hypothetical protein
MAKGGGKGGDGNKQSPNIKFDVSVVEFPKPTAEQFQAVDRVIDSLPGMVFGGTALSGPIRKWLKSLPDFQRRSFYQKASELGKDDNGSKLLKFFQELCKLTSDQQRTDHALERQLMLKTDPMAAAMSKLQVCLGALSSQVPAVLVVKTRRNLIVRDDKTRSDEWQIVIQEFIDWLEDDPDRKSWLAKLLAPLGAQEVLSHLANIVCLPEADRLNYTVTSTAGGKP